MSRAVRHIHNERQRQMVKLFETMAGYHNIWTLWCDFITMAACSLSCADREHREERERLYHDTAKRYSEKELNQFSEAFYIVVAALEENPNQDFLGELYMNMELGNNQNGQFFTPYNVSLMMGRMQAGELKAEIERKGYISVNDCCCGAGAMLIAFANAAQEQGVNYQQHVLFVAQDIDFTAAMMCYIQLSLLGCAGYVIVGNSLTTPPTESLSNQNVWYTPFYFLDTWHWRRLFKVLSNMTMKNDSEVEPASPDTVAVQEKPEVSSPRRIIADFEQLSFF